jgi:hypothetical protein
MILQVESKHAIVLQIPCYNFFTVQIQEHKE